MSINTSQAILKCFIDLNSSVWFTRGSEDMQKTKPCFVTIVTKTWNDLKPPKNIYNHLKPPTTTSKNSSTTYNHLQPPGGILPYITYTGMCRPKGS